MTIEKNQCSISTKVGGWAGIKLMTPGSAIIQTHYRLCYGPDNHYVPRSDLGEQSDLGS